MTGAQDRAPFTGLGPSRPTKGHPVAFVPRFMPVSLPGPPLLPLQGRPLEPLGSDIYPTTWLKVRCSFPGEQTTMLSRTYFFFRFFLPFAYFHPSLWLAVVSLLWSLFLVSVHPIHFSPHIARPSINFVPPWVGAFSSFFPCSLSLSSSLPFLFPPLFFSSPLHPILLSSLL